MPQPVIVQEAPSSNVAVVEGRGSAVTYWLKTNAEPRVIIARSYSYEEYEEL